MDIIIQGMYAAVSAEFCPTNDDRTQVYVMPLNDDPVPGNPDYRPADYTLRQTVHLVNATNMLSLMQLSDYQLAAKVSAQNSLVDTIYDFVLDLHDVSAKANRCCVEMTKEKRERENDDVNAAVIANTTENSLNACDFEVYFVVLLASRYLLERHKPSKTLPELTHMLKWTVKVYKMND